MSSLVYAEFVDDVEAIPDDAVLYRRVPWDMIGGKAKCPRGARATLNENCFTDWPDAKARQVGLPGPCMSVGVSVVLDQHNKPAATVLDSYTDFGLAWVRAGDLRRLERADGTPCPQGIMLCPTEREPWHGVVFDMKSRPRGGAAKKAIVRIADWLIPLVNDDE